VAAAEEHTPADAIEDEADGEDADLAHCPAPMLCAICIMSKQLPTNIITLGAEDEQAKLLGVTGATEVAAADDELPLA